MSAASWLSSDYTCTYDVANQTMTINRPVGDQSFFMVNDDLLADPVSQALVGPRTALFEAYDLDWDNTKTARALVGLCEGSSANAETAPVPAAVALPWPSAIPSALFSPA